MTGPCLCGDPACGRCFPQVNAVCSTCDGTGMVSYREGSDTYGEMCPDCEPDQPIESPTTHAGYRKHDKPKGDRCKAPWAPLRLHTWKDGQCIHCGNSE